MGDMELAVSTANGELNNQDFNEAVLAPLEQAFGGSFDQSIARLVQGLGRVEINKIIEKWITTETADAGCDSSCAYSERTICATLNNTEYRANCKSYVSEMKGTSTNNNTSSDDFTTGVIIVNAMIGVAALVALTVVVWSVCRKEATPTSGGSNGDQYTRMSEIDSLQADSRNSAGPQQDDGLRVSRKSGLL